MVEGHGGDHKSAGETPLRAVEPDQPELINDDDAPCGRLGTRSYWAIDRGSHMQRLIAYVTTDGPKAKYCFIVVTSTSARSPGTVVLLKAK